ncbi:putative Bardet-Biedl syndrome 1 protein [Trypanosoma grayi]|uniref:putative Bardet-Biedl syndrome 1 protein n=1 Tax=Trypanosoma grayi TaxID=71804 RepID=UPI0004F49675|nr:putative Bardet-Biedl syndrome 1 protein [Trypanosoma grayi]KEG11372.1 putative Bardet-Biedl syndrome 1 protein [Trypanosoma grayi]
MTSSETSGKKQKFWLYAFRDHLAGIQAFPNCVDVADIYGDGDYKLIVADGSRRIKMFSGTSLAMQLRLLSVPSALTTFYAERSDAVERPVVAVACGPYIFMYRNMKPLYRFTVPVVELDDVDVAVWDALRNGTLPLTEATDMLEERRKNGVELSARSTDLLASDNLQERERFVERTKNEPLRQMTVVACMGSLWVDPGENGRSCLVFGTEDRYIYVLKNSAMEVQFKVKFPSVPVQILTAGALRVQYRIVVACRDGCVYSIKNGDLSGSVIFPDGEIVQIARYDNLVAVATTRNTLSYFNLKGKRQSCIFLPLPVTNIVTIVESASTKARGIVVALSNGAIRVYVGKSLLHESQAYGSVTAMHYGRYGREDAALILLLQNGSLVVEMLHRHASFECETEGEVGPSAEQDVPIPVPPLTSVFVAQAERERTYSVDMHQSFQRDLCRLRLKTAKSYLGLLSGGGGGGGGSGGETSGVGGLPSYRSDSSLRMLTAVQGLGPVFKIQITLQNVTQKPMHDLTIILRYPAASCKVSKSIMDVPFLLPSLLSSYELLVERVGEEVMSDGVHVCVSSLANPVPLVAAIVELPDTGMMEEGV